MRSISLSLVSHTNAGKTTLARTLLGREIGVVRDAPHVTDAADVYTLIESPAGDRLLLWDTPGFGDSARLVRRLRASSQPIGWFLSQIWDRWRDRPFWNAQQAVRNLREEADVMLYLVNASETPEAAGYLEPELELLGWVGKPVIVLLNQLGAPREPAAEAAEVAVWRRHLEGQASVRAVLPLDAFARCWVQEDVLLRVVGESLTDPEAREAMARLADAGWAARVDTFDAAIAALASSLARIAVDVEPVVESGSPASRLIRAGKAIGQNVARPLGRRLAGAFDAAVGGWRARDDATAAAAAAGSAASSERHVDDAAGPHAPAAPGAGTGPAEPIANPSTPVGAAQAALLERLAAEVRRSTSRLIELHRLEGRAEGEALARLAADFDTRLAVDEGRAALWGGALSGALAGLKADLLSGGLTLGGGLVAGGLLGALGGAGLARGINLARGGGGPAIGWSAGALDRLFEAALLRYLAVAHFGRGRGAWSEGEPPAHWRAVVARVSAARRAALAAIWASRPAPDEMLDRRAAPVTAAVRSDPLAAAIQPLLTDAAADALEALYPEARRLLRESAGSAAAPSA